MSPVQPDATVDLLCIAADNGALGLRAVDVAAVREEDEWDGAADAVPSLDLASLLGEGGRGMALRRVRVAARGTAEFDLVTSGAITLRAASASALVPVPAWLAPLVEAITEGLILLEPDAVVLLADPAKLAVRCAPAIPLTRPTAPPPGSSHG